MNCATFGLLGLLAACVSADLSGPKAGDRLAPYMSIVSVGPNRGQLHCFV
jgi:hypothetical protein